MTADERLSALKLRLACAEETCMAIAEILGYKLDQKKFGGDELEQRVRELKKERDELKELLKVSSDPY